MIVTRRRYNRAITAMNNDIDSIDSLRRRWANLAIDSLGEKPRADIAERSLAAAESALDEKERIIERLQDDLYRMHDHLMYVREVMTDLP